MSWHQNSQVHKYAYFMIPCDEHSLQLVIRSVRYLLTHCYKQSTPFIPAFKIRTLCTESWYEIRFTPEWDVRWKSAKSASLFLKIRFFAYYLSSCQRSVLLCHCQEGLHWSGSANVMSFLVLDFILDLVLCRPRRKNFGVSVDTLSVWKATTCTDVSSLVSSLYNSASRDGLARLTISGPPFYPFLSREVHHNCRKLH